MSEFKIIREEFREGTDENGNPIVGPYYTFTVDGVPSLFWQPECNVPGLPKTYYIDRTIGRLKAGRSEAFGPPGVEVGDQVYRADDGKPKRARVFQEQTSVEVQHVPVHGGGTKPREKRPGWRYELDGCCCEESYPTEAAARAACAIRAFLSRGKLGRLKDVQAALEATLPGKVCRVHACPKRHTVVATVDGAEYSIGFQPDGTFRFKAIGG